MFINGIPLRIHYMSSPLSPLSQRGYFSAQKCVVGKSKGQLLMLNWVDPAVGSLGLSWLAESVATAAAAVAVVRPAGSGESWEAALRQ